MDQLISMGCFKLIKAVLDKLTHCYVRVRVSCYSKLTDEDDSVVIVQLQPLPDDVLVEILTRLPAEKVLECRRVCKHWNTLTSTPHFANKHFNTNSTNPSIVFMYDKMFSATHERIFLLDQWGLKRKPKDKLKRLITNSIYPGLVNGQYGNVVSFYKDGLLTFFPRLSLPRTAHSFVLYNPVLRQKLVLHTPPDGFLCACFYHSLAQEYRVLYCRSTTDVSVVEYQILSLGSPLDQLSWKRLSNFDLAPWCGLAPIRTCYSNNQVLHWVTTEKKEVTTHCSHYFLMFDVNKEEFSSMPHPGGLCSFFVNRHKKIFPFELKSGVDTLLCLCDCSIQDLIEMWVLEDHEKRTWVKRHTILLDVAVYRSQPNTRGNTEVEPFGVVNGEMLINMNRVGVFAYNISTGTLRKIIQIVDGSLGFTRDHDEFIMHVGLIQKSLISFGNSKDVHCVMKPY